MRGGTRLLTCGIDHPHRWGSSAIVGDYVEIKCVNCGAIGKFHAETALRGVDNFSTPVLDAARRGDVIDRPPLNIVTAIPPEVEQYAEDIRRFVDAMVYKLSVHADKGRWENMPIGRAEELLKGEVEELTEAIERGNLVEILLEAADVGNYALIISAIAIEKGK